MTLAARILGAVVLTGWGSRTSLRGAHLASALRGLLGAFVPRLRAKLRAGLQTMHDRRGDEALRRRAAARRRDGGEDRSGYHASHPPAALARDMGSSSATCRRPCRTLTASAAAARACIRARLRAASRPGTVVMIGMGNAINDINFTANVD